MNDEGSKLVPFARPRRGPDPARVAEFAATARRLQYERETSADAVTRALRDTPRPQWLQLAAREELQTCGALERLSQEVDTRLDHDPLAALTLSELSTRIADSLQADAYPAITLAQLRAHAWKDRGQSLCYLSRYDEALAALDRAEQILAPHGALAHDQAIVRFVRATTLQHLRRFDEAQPVLVSCRDIFFGHGDIHRAVKCGVAAGNLLIRRGDHRGGRATLAALLPLADEHAEATICLALAWCALELSEPAEALERFTEAERLFAALNRDLSALRASYGAGSALLRLGRLDDAFEQLQSARRHFLVRHLIEEAGLSGLELVEVYLLRDELHAAQALAAHIVQEFTDANLNRRAIGALAYLSDAMRSTRATPETVRNIHSYITALRTDPTLEFQAIN